MALIARYNENKQEAYEFINKTIESKGFYTIEDFEKFNRLMGN